MWDTESFEKKEEKANMLVYMQSFPQYHFWATHPEKENNFTVQKPKNLDKYEELLKKNREIEYLKEKLNQNKKRSELLIKINQQVERIIEQKNKNILKSKEGFNEKKLDFNKDKSIYENEINKIPKYNFIVDTLINKKMIEIIFAFFNNKMDNLYLIPDNYTKEITADKIKNIQGDYKKKYSAMMGNVANLLNYISKSLNIPFKYPFFVHGSKSFLIKSKKNFIQLFLTDDRVETFLEAVECLKTNLREIINYLATYTNIISEEDYERIIKNQTSNFFHLFVEFSKALQHFALTIPE